MQFFINSVVFLIIIFLN